MAEPIVTVYINTGTELFPVWTLVDSTKGLFFNGTLGDQFHWEAIITERILAVNPASLWISDIYNYSSNAVQIATYVPPTLLAQNQNVLRAFFAGAATTAAPILTAWDDSTLTTTIKQCLTGTANTANTSFFKGTESTLGAPVQNWCLVGTTNAGGNIINELNGAVNFVQCAAIAVAGGQKLFVLAMFVPSDAYLTGIMTDVVFTIQYDWI